MKAMVLAAGLGTRLRPLTYEIPKPMVPVLDRPVMAHILDLLAAHGFDEVIANLHYFPEEIRGYFGDEVTYRQEAELLGTAGGVRNCRDFFGDEDFLVISGDALTDIDLTAFAQRHRDSGGVATMAVKQVDETSQYGVVITDADGRISGFQEKPDPDEALSDRANCGIYAFTPEIFDYFPDKPFVDWADDVFPVLLDNDVAFHTYELTRYWNDVGSIDELRQGTFDALRGELRLTGVAEPRTPDGLEIAEGEIWTGERVTIGAGVKLQGPVVLGDGATIGDGAALKRTIVLSGTDVAPDTILIDAIVGHSGITASLRSRG